MVTKIKSQQSAKEPDEIYSIKVFLILSYSAHISPMADGFMK